MKMNSLVLYISTFLISMCEAASSSDFNGPLSKNTVNEATIVPANFSLSFDIKPIGTVSDWTSIIHYSKDKSNMGTGGRIPAIWFIPGTTKLTVRVATTANVNDGIYASIASLPLNATTNVRVEAFGRDVLLFLNNSFDSMVTVSADRIFGEATIYASNPWDPPALATIGSIRMKSISALSFKDASNFNGLISKLAVDKSNFVPADFALSFDIKPIDISSGSTNVIHYSQDNSDSGAKGRIPGTTKLRVQVATKTRWNDGIYVSTASLPMNAITKVRVEAIGRDVFLFLNKSFDSMVTVSADRISGAATLYVSNPWWPSAPATIGSIQMESISAFSFKASSDFNGPLSKLAVYETTFVPVNFALSLDIKPFKTVSELTNIIYYTQDRTDQDTKGGIPAIWFNARTTKLQVLVATKTNVNDGISSSIASLPLNATTNVRVEAFGRDVFLFLNDSFDSMVTVSADRISGAATLYVSNPWHTPASASIGSIQMKSFTNLIMSTSAFNGPLSTLAVYGETAVPPNFILSFNIKPFGTVSDFGSILYYRKSDMGSAAGIPGTTKLVVGIATIVNMNAGIEISNAFLPLNTTTYVRVEAFGRYVLLYLNNTLDTIATVSADRIFGEATFYASHPMFTPALASIGSIEMKSISDLSFKSDKNISSSLLTPAAHSTTVSANFSLSFDITPLAKVSELSSIIRYCKDTTDIGAEGRMPAIWFLPGTTKLHVRVATKADADDGIWGSITSLPLNTTTNVRVAAFGRDILLYLNNSLDSMASLPADRISGDATLFDSDPWWPSAQASIMKIQMISLSNVPFTSASNFSGPLYKLAVYEITTVPANFSLSFDITPFGTVSELASIIHYCKDKTDMKEGGRMPAIWFVAGTTKLHVRVATDGNVNAGIFASIGSLPLNATTNVRVEALGREVFLFLNNSFNTMASLSANRISGEATLFVSNPWSTPALASIRSIEMKSISALTVIAASAFSGRLSKFAVYERTTVPANFALSFNIKPSDISSEWSSIIHYSKDKTDMGPGGRMPAIWFIPGTTKLTVRVATSDNVNDGIFASAGSLPLDTTTNVRVEAFDREVLLYLNNSLDSKVKVSVDRISGEASLFVPNPWSTPALASIGSIEMKSISSLSGRAAYGFNGLLSSFAVYETTFVSANFSLSFDITPFGTVSELASIIHYTKDNTDYGSGGRIPGTTKLRVRVATTTYRNEGIASSAASLPLNCITNVRLEAIGRNVFLYLNNILDTKVTLSGDRISGPATLYASNPWHTPAAATIGSIQMKSL